MKKISTLMGFLLALFFLFSPVFVGASRIELQKDTSEQGDFMLAPGAFNINANPGDKITKTIEITNRFGREKSFIVEVEDFDGSATDETSGLTLLGDATGRYGAKDWVNPELVEVTIKHGERIYVNVEINVPQNADTGDHYCSVLVTAVKDDIDLKEQSESSSPNITVKSRVGSLFYIKVAGDIVEDGNLESFKTDKTKYEKAPINFSLVFRNNGNIRLQPSGKIVIKNSKDKQVEVINIEPFNVLRNSVKLSNFQWRDKFLLGSYTATLTLDRGYGEEQDIMTTEFSVIPWSDIIIVVSVLVALLAASILIKKQRNKRRR